MEAMFYLEYYHGGGDAGDVDEDPAQLLGDQVRQVEAGVKPGLALRRRPDWDVALAGWTSVSVRRTKVQCDLGLSDQ